MYKCLKEILSDNIRYFRRTLSLAYINQKKNYKGSALGPVWAFIKPVLYICVFYFAISIGFKSAKDIDGVITPYFIWLTTGMISWFYMRDMILGGASCFRKYRFLVTKMNYPVSTIPTIVSMSNLLIHCILMVGVLLLALAFGCAPTVYWIQLPVYMLLMFIFSIAFVSEASSSEDELAQAKNALNLLFAKVIENHDYTLPNGDPRTLTIVEKKKETPNKFPRKAGMPNKRPL